MTRSFNSTLHRTINLITDVKPDELKTALLTTSIIFLITSGYMCIKVLKEPLLIHLGGAELKSYSAAFQSVSLVLVLRLFSRLYGRYTRPQLISIIFITVTGLLLLFYVGAHLNMPIGLYFVVFGGIIGLLITTLFWSIVNDVYTIEEGKRLFVIFGFGASLGGLAGPVIAETVINLFGLYQLIPTVGVLITCALLLAQYQEKHGFANRQTQEKVKPEADVDKKDAFKLVFKNRYLLFIALLVLLSNYVNTTGEFMLSKSIENRVDTLIDSGLLSLAEEENAIADFYARYLILVGCCGLLIQTFLVSRIIKKLGVAIALLMLPAFAFFGYLAIAILPLFYVVVVSKITENAGDYSLNNTVKQMLYLPTSRDEKYKAKAVIDTFFVRAGDVLSASLVFVGTVWLDFGIRHFAIINVLITIAWFILAYSIGKLYKNKVVNLESKEPVVTIKAQRQTE